MSNPFMQYASGGSSSVTVNSIKPNARSNIIVPLSSLSDVNIIKESLSNGEILSWTDGKWGNIMQTPDTYPFTVLQALSQKNRPNGYAGLDNFSLIPITYIPDLPQSKKTNLSTSLSTLTSGISTINNAIGQSAGIATLDNNSFIPILNIPDIPQSKITNLTTALSTLTYGINLINDEIGNTNGIASLDANGKLNTNDSRRKHDRHYNPTSRSQPNSRIFNS